jgi:hypothetical protein
VQIIIADKVKICWLILKTMSSSEATLFYLSLSHSQKKLIVKTRLSNLKPIIVKYVELTTVSVQKSFRFVTYEC